MPQRTNNGFGLVRRGLAPALALAFTLALALMFMAESAQAASLSSSRADRRAARNEAKTQAEEVPLTPETFSHKLVLDGQAGSVLSFTLPEAVHKGLELTTFQDLCVFDADGTPVPFQLRAPQGTNQRLEVEKELPYFMWQPEKPGAGTPGTMDIEINAKGGIVRIKGQTDDLAKPGPVSYLLDMQAFFDAASSPVSRGGLAFADDDLRERAIKVLLAGDEPFMVSVTMKTSADLDSWTSIGRPQMLVRTRQGDVTLERDTLVLPGTAKRYLLLQFADSDVPIFSFAARAVFDKTTHEVRETIVPGTLSENKRQIGYTLPGRFPVTAIGFDLAQAEMMAVRLSGADDPEKPYAQRASGFIYRLERDGVTVTGEPFPVTQSNRYWRLSAAGDIPFAAAPGMRVYWQPRELLFLARGKGPWTLAFGRQTAVQASALPMLGQSDVQTAREIASPPTDTGATTPAVAKKEESREWVLWAVLILAVVFLSGVTVWLVRSMKK
ncbi:exported hypothetical protein [uncultured delta proteobacterium]|uniref:DUF3999 domain-containing protein n=1 Tax=uncultured delta proteobacterium TaxID=34034 RepID=A0A212J030_9DELT|nr:exported hypothetical protein [uncultured delta proteobacterium]